MDNKAINNDHLIQVPIKIFINECNSFLSQAIIEEIRNDHSAFDSTQIKEHKIYGTLTARENAPQPNGITKIIPKNRKKTIYQTILTSDVVIFDISAGGTDEVDAVVKMLKEQTDGLNKDLTLIILSSVMSWSGTPAKVPSSVTDRDDDEELTPEERDRRTTTDFMEDDYQTRMPSTRFSILKHIENLVLQLPKFQPLVKPYIVCTGIQYGNGERTLYDHFRKSWTGVPIPLLGDGMNILPAIHVTDVAKLIKRMIFDVHPKQIPQYILAVDHGSCTQKQIVSALAGGKEKKMSNVEIFDVYSEEWSDYLNIDLKMRPSKLFDNHFPWTSRDGICKNINKVMDEFATYRGLQSIRVSIIGPPMSGKTQLAKYLKSLLKVKRMTVRDVTEFCKKQPKSQLAHDIKRKEEELKDKVIEEHEKAKKKGPELHRETLQVKIPESLVTLAIKATLEHPDIKAKGLIMEQFPKSLKQLQRIYYKYPQEHSDWKNDSFYENLDKAEINMEMMPHLVIHLKCSRDASYQRFKIYQQVNPDMNLTELDFERRFNEFENTIHALTDFYWDLKLPSNVFKMVEINTMGRKQEDIYKQGKDQVFQQYKFLDYLFVSDANEKALIEKLLKQEEQKLKEEATTKAKQQVVVEQQYQQQNLLTVQPSVHSQKRVNSRLSKIEEKKHFLLDTRSLPIRQFLLDKIIPTLTAGIMDFTDKFDFEKINDELLQQDQPPYDGDLLLHLVKYFEAKGEELQNDYLEAKRKKEEEIEIQKAKTMKMQNGDDSDESDDEEDLSNP